MTARPTGGCASPPPLLPERVNTKANTKAPRIRRRHSTLLLGLLLALVAGCGPAQTVEVTASAPGALVYKLEKQGRTPLGPAPVIFENETTDPVKVLVTAPRYEAVQIDVPGGTTHAVLALTLQPLGSALWERTLLEHLLDQGPQPLETCSEALPDLSQKQVEETINALVEIEEARTIGAQVPRYELTSQGIARLTRTLGADMITERLLQSRLEMLRGADKRVREAARKSRRR